MLIKNVTKIHPDRVWFQVVPPYAGTTQPNVVSLHNQSRKWLHILVKMSIKTNIKIMTRNRRYVILKVLTFPTFLVLNCEVSFEKRTGQVHTSTLGVIAQHFDGNSRQTTRLTGRTADIPFQCRSMDLLKIKCWTLDLLNMKRLSFGLLIIRLWSLNLLSMNCWPLDQSLIILPVEPEVLTHWTSKTSISYRWISLIYSASNWISWTWSTGLLDLLNMKWQPFDPFSTKCWLLGSLGT
jgi:hypothetical protein